jgi:hypothetical protein
MEGVILNNCAIIDVDMRHIIKFCFVSALFSQVQGNAGQVGYIPLSHCLSSRQRLLSAGASNSCRTIASGCASFVPLFTLAVRRPGAILACNTSKSSCTMETFQLLGRLLLCCLLSSTTSRPAAPPSVHISLQRSLLLCPSFSGALASCPPRQFVVSPIMTLPMLRMFLTFPLQTLFRFTDPFTRLNSF